MLSVAVWPFSHLIMNKVVTMKTTDSQRHALYLYLAIASIILCLFFQTFYRSFILDNQISDFGIAGSSVSFWGPLCAMFYFYYRDVSANSFSISIATALGASIYECIQPFLKLGYFDWLDIIASCLAGLIFPFIVHLINKAQLTKES